MPQTLALLKSNGYGIDTNADWAINLTARSGVTAITAARMEIRQQDSDTALLIASFYSDGTGSGILTISGLTIAIQLPASVSAGFTFTGQAYYDLYATCDGNSLKVVEGPVDISPRVTR